MSAIDDSSMKSTARQRSSQPFEAIITVIAVLLGCGLAALAARGLVTGRIEYWTGPSEWGHFVATPDTAPVSYWLLISVGSAGALALWFKLVADLVSWWRLRARKGTPVRPARKDLGGRCDRRSIAFSFRRARRARPTLPR